MDYRLIILPAILLLAGCGKKAEVTLETATVSRGEISRSVTATGTVESKTQVDVGTQVTGIIDKLYVDFNDRVEKGQLIAEIEKTLLESELKSANAAMESARVTYEYNRTNFERDRQLHDKQLISDYEYETSRKEYETSHTAYEKSQADRVRAAKNLNYAEIYSPIDGVVISREVEVGQTVVSNMNVANLYTIADLENMQIVGNVDEADIGQVKTGQSVTFTVDAYPDDEFSGTVTQVRLNPTTESNVVTYEVIVDAPNPELKLIPGLTANLTIYTLREKDVLLAPAAALRFKPQEFPDAKSLPSVAQGVTIPSPTDSSRVLWTVHDGTLTPNIVTTGASNGSMVQIKSGITEGTVVAVDYSMKGRPDEGKDSSDGETERSPFAPGPPGRNKKK